MARIASHPFDVRSLLQDQTPRRPAGAERAYGRRSTGAARANAQQRRTYLLLPRAEADCLILAFHRFVELHGRAVSLTADACALDAVACPSGDTVMLALWSRHAASEFDRFWRRYRLFYGPETSCVALNSLAALFG